MEGELKNFSVTALALIAFAVFLFIGNQESRAGQLLVIVDREDFKTGAFTEVDKIEVRDGEFQRFTIGGLGKWKGCVAEGLRRIPSGQMRGFVYCFSEGDAMAGGQCTVGKLGKTFLRLSTNSINLSDDPMPGTPTVTINMVCRY